MLQPYINKSRSLFEYFDEKNVLIFFRISDKVCELQKWSGNYVVGDADVERIYKTYLWDCESECLNDEKCRAMYYTHGFCFIVYKDVPPAPYHDITFYYDKVCNHTYSKYSKMCFVNTHVKISMCLKILTQSMHFELR